MVLETMNPFVGMVMLAIFIGVIIIVACAYLCAKSVAKIPDDTGILFPGEVITKTSETYPDTRGQDWLTGNESPCVHCSEDPEDCGDQCSE